MNMCRYYGIGGVSEMNFLRDDLCALCRAMKAPALVKYYTISSLVGRKMITTELIH
jgi:hypothetical protein